MARSSNTLNIKMGENDQLVVKQEKFLKPNGELCVRRYVQSRLLGKGGFGKVYQFNCLETNELYAAKIIPKASLKDEMHMQKFKAEIKLHKMLEHQNIVKFERNFEDEENYYILLELCPNDNLGQLLQRRGKLTEVEVQYYIFHIAEGLKHIHEQKILHRDLKVANILLNSKMEVKIADFGLAAKLSSDFEKRKTVCGTPNFIAPEILDNSKGYSYPADIWSLGVICFNLLTGKLPFEAFSSKEIYNKIQDGKYSFPANIPLSIAAKDLVSKMLVVDPEQRIKLSKILRHPFLNPKGGIPSFMPTSTLTTIPPASLTKQTPVTEGPPKLSALFHKAETVKSARGERPQSMDKTKGLKQPPLPTQAKEKAKEASRERPKTPPTIRTPQRNKSDSSGENANAETKTSLNKENKPAVREESKEKIGKVGKDPLAESKTIETNTSKASLLKSRSNYSTKASSLNNLDKPATSIGVQNPVVIQRNNFANLFSSNKRVATTENTEPSAFESRAPLRILTSPVKEKEQVPAQQPEAPVVKKSEESGEILRIASYLDETANYGLTYVFSNKSVGILFNDDTKILLDPTGREFYYVEVGVTNKEAYVKYSLENYPEELKTKVASLERANKHFYKYVTERSEEKYTGNLYYVRKWLKTKHATLFRLNTQELQVIFIDGSVMSLSPNGKDLKYVKKTGEVSRYDLEKESLSKDQEVKKRLVYTMEVMEKLWNKK